MWNSREIPATRIIKTTKTLSSITVARGDIAKILKNLILLRPTDITWSVYKCWNYAETQSDHPEKLSPNLVLKVGIVPSEPKKANVVPVHKNFDEQPLKNYCPIWLFPICRKILEHLIYNKNVLYFIEKDLLSQAIKTLNPEIHVLTSCYLLPIYYPFDQGYQTRGVYFNKVWHKLKETVYQVIY